MPNLLVPQSLFTLVCVLIGAVGTAAFALFYFRRVRIDRPAIGTFNGRDIIVLFFFIVTLPLLYLILPHWALTSFLVLTFLASLSIGYRPLVPAPQLWLLIGLAIGGNIWIARTMLGTVAGWQLYWALTSVIVLLGASAVANLYVQGGMYLRHVAVFAFALAFYDAIFALVIPITPLLADAFIGYPLDPSIGMRVGIYNANIGIGDLLVYGLFIVAAFKAYGRKAARIAMGLIVVFGSAMPALAPLLISEVTRGNANIAVPAQAIFGPVALLTYLWMRKRWGRERTMVEFLASDDVVRRQVRATTPDTASAAPARPAAEQTRPATEPAEQQPVAQPVG
jgi:hypothetical protein